MLHGQRQVLLREVEHVEDDGLRAAVLAVVDGVKSNRASLQVCKKIRTGVSAISSAIINTYLS